MNDQTIGGGALGHPKVFINLDKPGPKACNYWFVYFLLSRFVDIILIDLIYSYSGIRFEQDHDHHH